MEEFDRIDEAFYREKQIQGWSRKKKEALIKGEYQKLPELSKNYTQFPSSSVASTSSATGSLLSEDVASTGSATGTLLTEDVVTAGSANSNVLSEKNTPLPELVEGKTMGTVNSSNKSLLSPTNFDEVFKVKNNKIAK